jgi:hypothetical protein
MSEKTTIRAFDVPHDVFNKTIERTGQQINDLAGFDILPAKDANKTFNMTPSSLKMLLQQATEQRKTVPQNVNEASSALTVARQTYKANPSDENKSKVDNAQQLYDEMVRNDATAAGAKSSAEETARQKASGAGVRPRLERLRKSNRRT